METKTRFYHKNLELLRTANGLGAGGVKCVKHQMLTIASVTYSEFGEKIITKYSKCINCGNPEWTTERSVV